MQKNKSTNPLSFLRTHIIYFITFILAYWAHLAGDLATPSSSWGGIALLYPSKDYIGGYGKIWWWNNYDIFLLILSFIIFALITPLICRYIKQNIKVFTTILACISITLIINQINTRTYNYEGTKISYAQMEKNSKEEQKKILGNRIYSYMSWFDSKLKFYF